MRILLLEDDDILHDSIKAYLEFENIDVVSAYGSNDVYSITYDEDFDLYLFDINVKGDDGFKILQSLRDAEDNTPTIYITALNDIESFSKGFICGADDYIKKPFNIEELIIKIKSKYMSVKPINYKNISYYPHSKILKVDNNQIYLSQTLLKIFHEFIINIDKIVIFDVLLINIENQSKNGLKTCISQLKIKLNIDIKSIRGIGYKLETI